MVRQEALRQSSRENGGKASVKVLGHFFIIMVAHYKELLLIISKKACVWWLMSLGMLIFRHFATTSLC